MDWYKNIYGLIEETIDCIDCLDEQLALEQQCMEYLDSIDESELEEGAVIRKVMRKGKAVRKKFCKLATQKQLGGRCVPRGSKERIKKSRSMRRAARKRRGKMSRILKKRKKSITRGKRMGLYK
tara:strand:+ start:1330 stop:1701 length:372 start_codon:yes stop_codon:yes gene_type:complete